MRHICERCKVKFSSWIYETGDLVTNICPACYYKAVNHREMQIQKIVADTLDDYDVQTAIGVYNKLTYPEKNKEKKKKQQ